MKQGFLFLLFSSLAFSQTADTVYTRAVLLPANETPPINNGGRGIADIVATAVRDASGTIVSGNLDILLRTTLTAATTATGLNLTGGLNTSISRPLQSGADSIHIAVPLSAANATSFFQDPTKFSLNLTTTDQPNGLMRGALVKAQIAVLMALMDSGNEVPLPLNNATGFGQVVAIGTRDAAGNWSSGEVYAWTTYTTDDLSAVNALHLHTGAAGTNGAVGINLTVPPGATPDPTGVNQLGPMYFEIATNNTTQTGTFTNLFVNPTSIYLELHTVGNTNGLLRAQLRPTEANTFPLLLDSAMEVNPPAQRTLAPANITVYTLRNRDGSIAAGTILADVNLRFATPQQFLGLYIHDAPAQTDGPMSIKAAPDFSSDTGFGNYYGWTPPITNLAALNDLLANPEKHYANLHSLDQPGGAVRAQFGAAVGRASIAAILSADLDKSATTIAPGGLFTIFGSNLAKVPASLAAWTGQQLPTALNGAKVTIGGAAAPLFYVSPNQINAQAPVDLAPGVQTVTVDNGSGASAALSVTVAPMAPAIFFAPVAAVLKNANFSLVSAVNPAHAGEVLLVYCTGLGQTTPALQTGALVPDSTLARTASITATLGGKPSTVVYAIASPGFAGLYQVAITVPSGVTGDVSLQLSAGSATSNIVTIPVQ